MLVRISDTQQVNTDHVVNVAQPNANDPNNIVVSLSNARQVVTDAAGHERLEAAMDAHTMPEMPTLGNAPAEPIPSEPVEGVQVSDAEVGV